MRPTPTPVHYRDICPGVDVVFRGDNGRLKSEFIVHPGASPNDIQLVSVVPAT